MGYIKVAALFCSCIFFDAIYNDTLALYCASSYSTHKVCPQYCSNNENQIRGANGTYFNICNNCNCPAGSHPGTEQGGRRHQVGRGNP